MKSSIDSMNNILIIVNNVISRDNEHQITL